MAEAGHGGPARRHFSLRDVPGTTIAVTSLALLGAAAVVTTPLWLWYRAKRRRTDALARKAAAEAAAEAALRQPADEVSTPPSDLSEGEAPEPKP